MALTADETQQSVSVPKVPPGFYVPKFTLSPDGRYGVLVPLRAWLDSLPENKPGIPPNQNRVIDVRSGRVVGVINAETGLVHANHMDLEPLRWSPDGSLLLWVVDGKWTTRALVLIKLRGGAIEWQTSVDDIVARETFERTRKAAPEKCATINKKWIEENRAFGVAVGSDPRGGFWVNVRVEGEIGGYADQEKGKPISLPLKVHAELTSNPKQIDWWPKEAQLDSLLDGVITSDGKFRVTNFSLREEPFDNATGHSWEDVTKPAD
jgi:hypothetical protein